MMWGWPNMMGGFFGGGLGWIGMIFGFIFFILVVIGIIFLIVWLVKRSNYPGVENRTESKSLEVLKERYAKGEITKDQFDNMKKDLN
ncbi:MAG: SHOCT domain-containing protein [Candidatus Humimicrobiaceae bacterium]